MIKSLLIKNFILIDELFLEFKKGLNVFTGETGAGKSIILKALDVVLGAKAAKEMLKPGAKSALIEAVFHTNEEEIFISREISQTGTKCRINGALVNLDSVKEIREKLVDIHSQHQTYTYIQPKYHVELLDSFAGFESQEYKNLLLRYKNCFIQYKEIAKKLDFLKENNQKNIQEIEFLKFQLEEIEQAQIQENEEDSLNAELEKLSNLQELKNLCYGAHWALGAQDESILAALSKINFSVSRAVQYDKELSEIETSFVEALENLKYCSDSLRNYSENLQDNPLRLDEINERLSVIEKLKRKYGNIFEAQIKFANQLEAIQCDAGNLDELEKTHKALSKQMVEYSEKLTHMRIDKAQKLSLMVEDELKKLELQNAKFKISVLPKTPDINGADNVEFLIAANVSQDLMPLIKAASGGEISRVMLAIKTIFSKVDEVGTVVFDEIDTGISGKTSQAVASALYELSKDTQVFVVTHQPIIAAKADAHFCVSKEQNETTKILVKELSENNKVEAIAKLASGEVSQMSLSFARELLNSKNY